MVQFGPKLWGNAFQTIPDVLVFDAENTKKSSFCNILNGGLPPEDGSIRPQTLGKHVSDDPRHRQTARFGGAMAFWTYRGVPLIRNHRFGVRGSDFLRKNKKFQKFSPYFLFSMFLFFWFLYEFVFVQVVETTCISHLDIDLLFKTIL